VITVSTTVAGGPSAQITVDFIATDANSMTLQADPIAIGVNTPDSEAQQSEIIAVVRDQVHNLVKGKRIDFTLEDVTGGRIFPSSAVTDSFGRANTIYIAGISPSAVNGVRITAKVVDTPTVTASVNMTVATKSLFITLGTGNLVEIDGPTRYKKAYTVLVNDANGVAVTDTDVVISLLPLKFAKGHYKWEEERKVWVQIVTSTCPNEDNLPGTEPKNHFNGFLDAGEDFNGSGKLEPGNVATFDVATFDSNNILKTVKTDANGFADFYIVYPKENAGWVYVRLIATATVAGSEGSDQNEFVLSGASEDYSNEKASPPGNPSPYGLGIEKVTVEDVNELCKLDPGEDGSIIENGLLDTEDKNCNGILDPGEDGSIIELPGRLCSETGVEGAPSCNPRVGQLDTEDVTKIVRTSEFVPSCDNTD